MRTRGEILRQSLADMAIGAAIAWAVAAVALPFLPDLCRYYVALSGLLEAATR